MIFFDNIISNSIYIVANQIIDNVKQNENINTLQDFFQLRFQRGS